MARASSDPIATERLGRSDVAVTRISIGTNPLGNLYDVVAEDDAERALAAAWAAGIRYFDTAPLYGYGLAEQRLGRMLEGLPRDEYVVSTKVGRLLREDAPRPEVGSVLAPAAGVSLFPGAPERFPVFDYSADAVKRSIAESLERLGLDRVDVVYIHDPDDHYAEALNGAYPVLARLRDEGVVGAIGVGMNQTQMLARFAREADFDAFLLAGRYSLLDQQALDELFPLCLERGIGIVLGGVFNGGILADPSAAMFDYRPAETAVVHRARRLQQICERWDTRLPAAALRFAAAHPAVTSVVVGVRSPAELADDLAYLAHPIPDELWDELMEEGLLRSDAPRPVDQPSGGESREG